MGDHAEPSNVMDWREHIGCHAHNAWCAKKAAGKFKDDADAVLWLVEFIERLVARARKTPAPATLRLVGPCQCGFGKVEMPDYLDSGTVLKCLECDAEIVVDVWSPEARTKFFAIYEKGLADAETK
jgi:hypothetical protein